MGNCGTEKKKTILKSDAPPSNGPRGKSNVMQPKIAGGLREPRTQNLNRGKKENQLFPSGEIILKTKSSKRKTNPSNQSHEGVETEVAKLQLGRGQRKCPWREHLEKNRQNKTRYTRNSRGGVKPNLNHLVFSWVRQNRWGGCKPTHKEGNNRSEERPSRLPRKGVSLRKSSIRSERRRGKNKLQESQMNFDSRGGKGFFADEKNKNISIRYRVVQANSKGRGRHGSHPKPNEKQKGGGSSGGDWANCSGCVEKERKRQRED